MNIHDLNTSISEMSEKDLMERIRLLRGERRKSDKPIKKPKKPTAKKKKATVKNPRTMLTTMSREEKLALLASLES